MAPTSHADMFGDQIRVLDLLPNSDGDLDSPIKCEIRIVSLAAQPQYTTVSYVWGYQSTGHEHIELNGAPYAVSESIYAALRRLRFPDAVRTLWIDQICINQEDLREKASQVRLMRQIYANCSDCLAWLGEVRQDIPIEDAKAAMEFIEYMAQTMDARDAQDAQTSDEYVEVNVPAPSFMDSLESFEGPIRAVRAISVNEHPWWDRIWTVQEAVLPPKLDLILGELSLPWARLVRASNAWTQRMPPALPALLTPDNTRTMGDFMAHTVWVNLSGRGDSYWPLDLLIRWRIRKATNPLDKVYGLMGLLQQGELPNVEHCDYSTSKTALYASTTIDMIAREGDLRPLVAEPRLPNPMPGMPNWALDLTSLPPAEIYYTLNGYYAYNAAFNQDLDVEAFIAATSESKDTLPLKGCFVDKIKQVILPQITAHPHISDPELVAILRQWAKKAGINLSFEINEHQPAQKMSRSEAFGRMLIGDMVRNYEDWFDHRAGPEDALQALTFVATGDPLPPLARQTLWRLIKDLTFFVSEKGSMGLAHKESVPGDEIWIFHGGWMPFTIRPRHKDTDFDFVGRCYLEGVMFGEVFENPESSPEVRDVRLY